MRILAIRGQNLASLAAPFEVRLDEGPLGGAGLFAVVGETGAGKSTLLDAACLALYGKCPRVVAEGGRDDLPDVSDSRISSNDPRTVLRRGAATGFAEVDFVGGDAERYRATWSVRRARDRSDGRLQNAQWSLVRLVDGQGVADGIEQTRTAVEKIVGLTFDQFRRTVLLAQGDFDAFLRADDRDRADLLEKVTGAEIYARISRRVFEAAREKRDAEDRLRQRLEDVGGLSAEAREALEVELSEAGAAVGRIRTERDTAQAQLDIARRRAAADRALEDAKQAAEAAQTAWSGAAPDQERLALLDAAEGVRPALKEETDARTDLTKSQTAAEKAHGAFVAAQAEVAEREGQAKAAAERQDAAEDDFKAFGPIWSEAEQLDGRLAAAVAARTKADQALAEALAGLNTAKAALEAAQASAEGLKEALAKAEAQRAEGPNLTALALRDGEIKSEFESWAKARSKADGASRAVLDHAAELESLTQEHAQAAAALADLDAAAKEAETAWRKAAEAVADVDDRTLESRRTSLVELERALDDAASAHARYHQAAARQANAAAAATEAGTSADSADARVRDLEARRAQTEAELRAATRFRALADEGARAAAEQLRHSLETDEPCPVCGSRDHPFAADAGAVGRLAEAQREEVDRLAAAQTAIEAELAEARGSSRSLRTAQAQHAATADGDAADRQRDLGEWLKARAAALETTSVAGVALSLPDRPDADTAEPEIARARTEAELALTAARKTLDALRQGRQTAEALAAAALAKQTEATSARERSQQASDRLAKAEVLKASLAEKAEGAAREAAGARRRLVPIAAAAGLTETALDTDPNVADDVIQAIRRWCELTRQIEKTAGELQRLDASGLQLSTTVVERQAAEAAARMSAGDAQATETDLRSQRAGLLGGEPTSEHRTRHNQARLEATEALRTARDLEATARASSERAAAEQASAESVLQSDATRLETRSAEADRALAAAGLDRSIVADLLAAAADERASLRAHLGWLEDALRNARAVAQVRETESIAAHEAAAEAGSLETLEQTWLEIDGRFEAAVAAEAALAGKLHDDDDRRQAAATLQDELAVAERAHAEHGAVSDAIGSADGSKFRRIAQRITLAALVQYANAQLEGLAPRYLLTQAADESLGLWVVDQDMGAEVRSTRSLSGGERFLVSLALALALAGLEGRGAFVQTLFIDEGFGALDATTLDAAVDALEALQSGGRQVGVITHVRAMIDRITAQVRVEKQGGGKSRVVVADAA